MLPTIGGRSGPALRSRTARIAQEHQGEREPRSAAFRKITTTAILRLSTVASSDGVLIHANPAVEVDCPRLTASQVLL